MRIMNFNDRDQCSFWGNVSYSSNKQALLERNKYARKYKALGHKVHMHSLAGQLCKYSGLGQPDGRIGTVYYLDVFPVTQESIDPINMPVTCKGGKMNIDVNAIYNRLNNKHYRDIAQYWARYKYVYDIRPFEFAIPWKPRLGIFKHQRRSIVTFDPHKMEAVSYGHWVFFKVINGKTVFNDYSYSMTTNRHQSEVQALLRQLGIKIDLTVRTRLSLHDSDALSDALKDLYIRQEELYIAMKRRGARVSTNKDRRRSLMSIKREIRALKGLGAYVTDTVQLDIQRRVVQEEAARLDSLRQIWESKARERQAKRTAKQLEECINGPEERNVA